MAFISPMLAAPMPKQPLDLKAGQFIAEEKYDGHRLVVQVSQASAVDLYGEGVAVTAWSRYGAERILPNHIIEGMQLPEGVYDGELLVPGHRSYGVTELVNSEKLVYIVFDVLELLGESTVEMTYGDRRSLLRKIAERELFTPAVQLSRITSVEDMDGVRALCKDIWARDGEGVILKRVSAPYSVGKRPKDAFIKIKQLRSAVLKVTGYEPGRNGPVATVRLADEDGNETSVKTLNNDWLARLGADPQSYVGRRLRIEFQERTPDGSYRHPRWDRWEDE